jgi:hypothetical protein
MVTPKLLPDLPFPNDVTIFCVFNGPFWVDQKGMHALFYFLFASHCSSFSTCLIYYLLFLLFRIPPPPFFFVLLMLKISRVGH